MQTKKTFRLLVGFYAICAIAELFTFTRHAVPPEIYYRKWAFYSSHPLNYTLINTLADPLLVMASISLLGLFFFWNFARYMFTFTIICQLLFSLMLPFVFNIPIENILGEIEYLLSGVIIALIYFSPIKEHFHNFNKIGDPAPKIKTMTET